MEKKTKKKVAKKISGPNEKEIEKSLLEYLEFSKVGFFWKNDSTGIFDPLKKTFRKKVNKHSVNGVSDILGVLKNGKFIAIEVKTPERKNNVSASQVNFLTEITKNHGYAFVVSSLNELDVIIKRIKNRERIN